MAFPSSLGYEPYDARLWDLGRSLVTALASGNSIRYLVPVPPSLRCLALSRRIRFTDWFTGTVLDVRLRTLSTGVSARDLAPRPSVSQAGHIPSWHGWCESYALSAVAGACRWLLLLLSPLLSGPGQDALPGCPRSSPGDCPHRAGDGPRILARLAAWPLVSGQSASGGSMSRVAKGHFRRKREAPLILRGSTSQFRGHPRT